jgi:hypothetical protein
MATGAVVARAVAMLRTDLLAAVASRADGGGDPDEPVRGRFQKHLPVCGEP